MGTLMWDSHSSSPRPKWPPGPTILIHSEITEPPDDGLFTLFFTFHASYGVSTSRQAHDLLVSKLEVSDYVGLIDAQGEVEPYCRESIRWIASWG